MSTLNEDEFQVKLQSYLDESKPQSIIKLIDTDRGTEDEEEEETSPFHWLEGDSLAPPCQSDYEVIKAILSTVRPYVSANSLLYDLGCGDGRICIAATAIFQNYSIGVEIEKILIERFHAKVDALSMKDPNFPRNKIQIINENLLNIPFDQVKGSNELNGSNISIDRTILVIYLLPESIELIREKLVKALTNGCVILFNTWGLKGIEAKEIVYCGYANNTKLLLYTEDCINS
jgi:SAM-dependent methyltransferase